MMHCIGDNLAGAHLKMYYTDPSGILIVQIIHCILPLILQHLIPILSDHALDRLASLHCS